MTLLLSWKGSVGTAEIIRECLPGYKNVEVERMANKIGTTWQIFTVSVDDCSWEILRNNEEIRKFIKEYNSEFKSKLSLSTFKQVGVKFINMNQNAHQSTILQEFLEIKDRDMGKIGSFQLLKKSGGRYKEICCRLPWQWKMRNFIVTATGVMYYSNQSKEIKEYMPFHNKSFKLLCGKQDTDFDFGIVLEANHRKLLLYAQEQTTFFRFVYLIKEILKHMQGPQINMFGSFAPPRQLQNINFLIDGKDYFDEVYQALQKARFQIMICDWMISPQLYLKRPTNQFGYSRLDRTLARAADRQVKIFILIYNQSSFLTNDSAYAKETFESLSSNIKVLKHPLGILPTFWSHHQKIIIIDQEITFMGGIDLCYGRYDTTDHSLLDNGPLKYPGIDHSNSRIKDIAKVRQFWIDGVPRDRPRLPWHDFGVRFQGEPVQDYCNHFIEYWNYASFQTHFEDRYLLILDRQKPKGTLTKLREGIQNKIAGIKMFASGIKDKLFNKETENDNNVNTKAEQPIKSDQIKLQIPNRMVEIQQDSSKQKQSRQSDHHFMPQRSNTQLVNRSEAFRTRMLAYQQETYETVAKIKRKKKGSVLKSINEIDDMVENMTDQIQRIDYIQDIRVTNPTKSMMIRQKEKQVHQQKFECQVLRSVGGWSIGCDPSQKQQSIHKAYIHMIDNAKYFIYIENQFFISAVQGNSTVKNQIGIALCRRIIKAHRDKQNFKVYIIIPLVPGFAGQLDDPDAVLPRVIMHWQYNSINRHQNSLFTKLIAKNIRPDNYIIFMSLRTHGIINSLPTTQIVYIHSKLMIVDDREIILGSANINDRSMRGSRDSETCIRVEGKNTKKGLMGDFVTQVSIKIRELRIKFWKEHFGEQIDFENPITQKCFTSIKKRAKMNTSIYRQVFHCYPDDTIKSLKALTAWKSHEVSQEKYEKVKNDIKGGVVELPLQFLKDQDLLAGSSLYPDSISV